MPEINKADAINQIALDSASIRKNYLEPIAKKLQADWHSQKTMRMAVFAACADALGLKAEARAKFFQQMDSSPSWFGCNASAGRQSYEKKTGPAAATADYTGF